MAKKAVAATNIKSGETFVEAGQPVDLSKFSKEELKELHANGAIEIVESKEEDDTSDAADESGAETSGPDTKVTSGEDDAAAKKSETAAPSTPSATPVKATSAPAKAASPEVKK